MRSKAPLVSGTSGEDSAGTRTAERAALRRGFMYMTPHRLLAVMILACVIVRALLELVPALITKTIIDQALPNHDAGLLNWLVTLMVISPTIYESLGVWQNYANTYLAFSITNSMRSDLYGRFLRMPMAYYDQSRTGEDMSKLMNDCDAMTGLLNGSIPILLRDTSKIFTTIGIAFVLSPGLTLLLLAVFSTYALPTRFIGRKMKEVQKETQAQLASFTEFIRERIGASLFIRYQSTEAQELNGFERQLGAVVSRQLRSAVLGRLLGAWGGLVQSLGIAALYGAGGYMVLSGSTTIGTLTAFAVYMVALHGPIQTWSNMYVDILKVSAILVRVFQSMDLPVEKAAVRTSTHPDFGLQTRSDGGALSAKRYSGRIEFRNVVFRYGADLPFVLNGIDFICRPGEAIAFVGRSGSGKSTILEMILGLYAPEQGDIRIDGVPLRERDMLHWRQRAALVSQDTLLWNDSLAKNINYGSPSPAEDNIRETCRDARLSEWIDSLPEGYDTPVGSRGLQLSGGQRQRVSLARAFLRDPDVLLLDEATSALDTETERLVMNAIRRRMEARTVVIVAHRLSTVKWADRIYVMDEGRIVESGTHDELMALSGAYVSLYMREEQATH